MVVDRGEFPLVAVIRSAVVDALSFSKMEAKSPRWLTSKDCVPGGGKRDKRMVRVKGMLA
jgi:hypothetical protein